MIPLSDWMILEERDEDLTTGRLVIPESVKEKTKMTIGFKVLKVGKGWWENGKWMDSPVKKGDIILLDAPLVARFTYRGIKYVAAKARDAAFIIEKEDLED